MTPMDDGARFHWGDYLVFGLSLLLSAAVGVFYGWKDRNKDSAEEFLMAGRSMPVLPVSLSLFVSWISAISFLGDPVEVYYHGAVYWVIGVGYISAIPLTAMYFAPVFYRMKVTSAYQYLEWRYHHVLRIIGSVSSVVVILIYLGIVLYAPSLALSQVSGLQVWVTIVSVGVVCTFYTTLGGMKAVLWADTLQTVIMFTGMVAILIQGTITLGGPSAIWQSAQEGGRINFDTFNPNPLIHATVWTYGLGGFFRVVVPYTSSQIFIQRYCTCKSEKDMKKAVLLNMPLYFIFVGMFGAVGLIMYVYYKDCDPLLRGVIYKKDQLLPLLVLEILGHLPGVPGLFMACVFSASLSTLSSGLNAIAANLLTDIAAPLYKKKTGTCLSDKKASILAKAMSALLGVLVIGMAFAMMNSGQSQIFGLVNMVIGSVNGPISGAFLAGLLFPFVKTLHACIGGALTMSVTLWICVGSLFQPPPPQDLPTSAACEQDMYSPSNLTLLTNVSSLETPTQHGSYYFSGGSHIYSFSPVLFIGLGPFLCTLLIFLSAIVHRLIDRIRGEVNSPNYDTVPTKDVNGQQQMQDLTKEKIVDEVTNC